MDETSSAKPKDEIFLETTQRASDFKFSAAVERR
jgi:hypothetical protein